MEPQRRYREDEVREIFREATRHTDGAAPLAAGDGLTLAELQEIGREVDLHPAAIARAAAALDLGGAQAVRRRSLGMPIAVGRVVALPRAVTDAEWERLVAELRSVFGARGRVSTAGGLREWVNGNLHACIEPSDSGYQLRLGTMNANGRALNRFGAVGIVTGAIALGATLASGGALLGAGILGASSAAAMVANALRLPGWARRREEQMRDVGAKLLSIMSATPSLPPGS